MSQVNLLRDVYHVNPGQPVVPFSGPQSIGATIAMGSTGIVEQTKASAFNNITAVGTAFVYQWFGAGCLITQPIVDSTPYKVQASIVTQSGVDAWVFVGYAPAAPTGTDLIEKVVAMPISPDVREYGEFNKIILVPGLPESDPYFSRPIGIGIAVRITTGNPEINFNISVQNLSKTAPQFAASMS